MHAIGHLLGPSVWLSNRLSFPRKYLLIGAVMLTALALLGRPLLEQTGRSIGEARLERVGLQAFVEQYRSLSTLVDLRSRALSAPVAAAELAALTAGLRRLQQAPGKTMADAADDGTTNLRAARSALQQLDQAGDAQQRFALLNGSANALLGEIRQSARRHRLNVDGELDVVFNMLVDRLPALAETLGRQRDALVLGSAEMASVALGMQVVLSDAAAPLKAGTRELVRVDPSAAPLEQQLARLLQGLAQQQDLADKATESATALQALRAQASANLQFAQAQVDDTARAVDRVLDARIHRLQQTRVVIVLVLVGALAAISYLFVGMVLSVMKSLRRLSQGTQAFCAGRLDTRISLDTQDELVRVADNFNTVASEMQRLLEVVRQQNESRERELESQVKARTVELAEKNIALEAAGQQVQEELDLARNMQHAILPQLFPDEPGWAVHASMIPARELGGDFYDCFRLADGRCGVLVADVSGKGVGAAFFMAVSRTILLELGQRGQSPAWVLAQANDRICERNPMELFVTACYSIFDPADGSFVHASAGHPPALLRRRTGSVEVLASACEIALGCQPGMDYTDQVGQLQPGDSLLLFSDGVTEAFAADGQAYGDARLRRWLAGSDGAAAPLGLVNALVDDVAAFVGTAEASDDLTCLVLKRKPGALTMDDSPGPIEIGQKTLLLEVDLPSRLDEIVGLADAVDRVLPDRPDLAQAANLCLEELITNTIQHALGGVPDRMIHVRISISAEWLEIIVKDDAPAFDPFAEAPAPDLDSDLDDRSIGGLGVHLVKSLMDDTRAYYDGSGNLIVLLKTLHR